MEWNDPLTPVNSSGTHVPSRSGDGDRHGGPGPSRRRPSVVLPTPTSRRLRRSRPTAIAKHDDDEPFYEPRIRAAGISGAFPIGHFLRRFLGYRRSVKVNIWWFCGGSSFFKVYRFWIPYLNNERY
ncbi:unnamed protein product [Callosobruchus maculatus]|uniref:Uncharacterized protein n=1 Tax=Callosobruchus maculatus TaxID=64391 RepID=A0A653BEA6_CALMS|nr:unnamed protein product [Callosobruchus maculatus]